MIGISLLRRGVICRDLPQHRWENNDGFGKESPMKPRLQNLPIDSLYGHHLIGYGLANL